MLCSIYNYFFGKKSIDELQITKNNIEIKNDIETINDVNIKNNISKKKNYNEIIDIYCVYMSKKNVICINKTNRDIILFNSTNHNILYIIEYVNIKCNISNLKKYDIKNL